MPRSRALTEYPDRVRDMVDNGIDVGSRPVPSLPRDGEPTTPWDARTAPALWSSPAPLRRTHPGPGCCRRSRSRSDLPAAESWDTHAPWETESSTLKREASGSGRLPREQTRWHVMLRQFGPVHRLLETFDAHLAKECVPYVRSGEGWQLEQRLANAKSFCRASSKVETPLVSSWTPLRVLCSRACTRFLAALDSPTFAAPIGRHRESGQSQSLDVGM